MFKTIKKSVKLVLFLLIANKILCVCEVSDNCSQREWIFIWSNIYNFTDISILYNCGFW